MALLNPLALFSIAAILIPLAIHLWNVKQGKTLKVGSIILLGESARQSSSSLHLRELLLLLLRCLLIILFAILLAQPIWRSLQNDSKAQKWIILEQQQFNTAYTQYKALLDSLLTKGYELHHPDQGFTSSDPGDTTASLPASITWGTINILNTRLPAGSEAYLFSPNTLSAFTGTKPATGLKLNWKFFTSPDSVSRWVQQAYRVSADSIRVLLGESRAGATQYTARNYSLNQAGDPRIDIRIREGKPYVALKNDSAAVALDSSRLSVSLVHKGAIDAAYLRAALGAIRQFSRYPVSVSEYADLAKVPSGQDWVFILSEKPSGLSDYVRKNPGSNVFSYAGGKAENTSSRIAAENWNNDAATVDIYKQYTAATSGNPVWKDGYGKALLSQQGNSYVFYSRFDPQWNGLVWSPEFPRLILSLLIKEQASKGMERRSIDPVQLAFAPSASQAAEDKHPAKATNMEQVFAFLLILGFGAERVLSFKQKALKA